MTSQNPILWTPDAARIADSRIHAFASWLAIERGLDFDDYNAMWAWSVSDLDGFWSAIWSFFDIPGTRGSDVVLAERRMPGAVWFPDAHLNFAEVSLRQADATPQAEALVVQSETFGRSTLTWGDLAAAVARMAGRLQALGVGQGDRVAAVLPNTEVALIAFLATARLGAIWSLCAPDMGQVAILDRFRQIAPKVLIAQDGYVHAGRMVDRREVLDVIRAGLPSVTATLWVPVAGSVPDDAEAWDAVSPGAMPEAPLIRVPFDHPLWIVYSSGTTGNPKPIVQGHGGVVLEAAKQSLHLDLSASDRFSWLTSSGWIMWNAQTTALHRGATVAMWDGAANHPDLMALWRFAARERLSYFGAGAAFFDSCRKAAITPGTEVDLGALRALGSTGSPLSRDGYAWIYDAVKADVWLAPISGGTDICGAFVGGNPTLPVRAGEMQCRFLGNAVRAFDEAGRDLIGTVGELVCTEPLPSMPLYFWGDDDGSRLHDSYFDTYPGIWRHGDWIEITEEGGAIIYGRSDATINRKGLRLGSAEIYRAVEALDEVMDSLVIDLEYLGRDSFMPLFVVLAEGLVLDDALKARIADAIRRDVSPRFVPSEIVQIAEVPRTLSGKKLEVPVKKLLLGGDPDRVVNRDSMSNPDSFDTFIAYASERAGART